MPFTLAHPSLILPFLKNKNASATALVVGSMCPDFIYFFRLKTENDISHTFLGILLLGFPLGFIVMFAFHLMVKKPLINNLPSFFQERLFDLKNSNWLSYFRSNILKVIISFYFGALTHLFMDSFVHSDGYFVERISFLNRTIFNYDLYAVAQYVLSLLGLVIIAIYFCKQPPRTHITQKVNYKFWILSIVLSIIIFYVRHLLGWPLREIGKIVASALFSSILAIAVASFFLNLGNYLKAKS